MKIAAVSMTYNDDYKLIEWKEHYLGFKDDVEWFIIVDNNSKKEYLDKVKKEFTNAIIIERSTNGGCTAAYNDGIRYALEHTDCDSIAIIANDMKLSENCLPVLHNYLFSDDSLGIASTAILYKDTNTVDNFGHRVKYFKVKNEEIKKEFNEIKDDRKYTDLLTGGFTLAKREFYIKCGLQDEKLFMYCDELDTTLKANLNSYKLGVSSEVYTWHWHITAPALSTNIIRSSYLIARNRIYLSKKYYSNLKTFTWILYLGLYKPVKFFIAGIIKRKRQYFAIAYDTFRGVISGICNNMQNIK